MGGAQSRDSVREAAWCCRIAAARQSERLRRSCHRLPIPAAPARDERPFRQRGLDRTDHGEGAPTVSGQSATRRPWGLLCLLQDAADRGDHLLKVGEFDPKLLKAGGCERVVTG